MVVFGSGAAGFSTALAASVGGADVLVLERSALVGGTSALSGRGSAVASKGWFRSAEGIGVELVDLRCLVRLDLDAVLTSVRRTKRAVV